MKDIKGYEGLYAITSCGKVWSYRSQKFLKPCKDKKGYLMLNLYKDGIKKGYRVHRLVAEAYIPNPNNFPDAGHDDDIKEHNYINNLYWTTPKENNSHGTHPEKISRSLMSNNRASKRIICIETGVLYESGMDAYRRTGISNGSISHVLNGRAKTAGNYHWRYAE